MKFFYEMSIFKLHRNIGNENNMNKKFFILAFLVSLVAVNSYAYAFGFRAEAGEHPSKDDHSRKQVHSGNDGSPAISENHHHTTPEQLCRRMHRNRMQGHVSS